MDELVKDIIRPQASCKSRGVSENEQQVTFQDVRASPYARGHPSHLAKLAAWSVDTCVSCAPSQHMYMPLCANPSAPQVAGLWVLLGASIGVACVLLIAHQLTMRGVRKVKQTAPYQASARKVRGALERLGSSGRRWAPKTVAASVRTAEGKTGLVGSDKSEASSEQCSPPLV